jgi:ABC-type sugar transport system ATPase subunit
VSEDIVLQLKDVSKHYPGVCALENINLSFRKGEVHALVGENGAGKSTLIKIVSGAICPTAGTVVINGREFPFMTPNCSKENGIATVYQELNLVKELSVAENIFLGEKFPGRRLFNRREVNRRASEIFNHFAPDLQSSTIVGSLTIGYQQMVEITKGLSKNAQIIILDEPTAPLSNDEVDILFDAIEKLKSSGVTIIYISHRLDEIFRIADRVTVLRDGQYITTKDVGDTCKSELIKYMVGREMTESFPVYEGEPSGEVIMELRNVTGNGLKDISFRVKKGEILGLGGLIGAGRTELAQMIFGAVKPESGQILMKGKPIAPQSPYDAIALGVSLVPEDRKQQGLVLGMSIRDNITMACVRDISKWLVIDRKQESRIVDEYKNAMRIKLTDVNVPVMSLSGGNQQKVVLAKWMATKPEIIIFDEPTRGIDVGAKYEIYLLMHELLRQGKTLIMITSDMEELINMSDRIVVLSEGRKTGELARDEFDQETILQLSSKIIP